MVTVPNSKSFKSALAFVKTKKDWILKNQIKLIKQLKPRHFFLPDQPFATNEHKLTFEQSTQDSYVVEPGEIKIFYTAGTDLESTGWQDFIREAIDEAYRIEAKKVLPKRTYELAKKHNFKYNKVSVRNAKTRWGSCSGINNISLNIQLMRLPIELIDYIILHELCHTIEKNHGKKFWALLDKVSGDAKGLDNEVKKYTTTY